MEKIDGICDGRMSNKRKKGIYIYYKGKILVLRNQGERCMAAEWRNYDG